MCSCVIVMRPELKIVLVAVEIIVVIAAALALEQCGTGSENSDKGYISGEYSGGAQEKIDYEAKTVAIDSGHGGIDPGKISADGILEKDVNLAIASKLKILLEQSAVYLGGRWGECRRQPFFGIRRIFHKSKCRRPVETGSG